MSSGPTFQSLRVEQALRLLPEVDVLAPLRAFLISTSRTRQDEPWQAEPYSTIGKRRLQASDLRGVVPRAIDRVSEHLTALYEAAVDALQSEQRGDLASSALALIRAGALEERVGRYAQAHQWYSHALGIAEELRDRRPEIAALRQLARLEMTRGHLDESGRAFQRSHALAEAEMDAAGAAEACLGLGEVAVVLGQWQGAEAWLTRGLKHAAEQPLLRARLTLSWGEVARRRGEFVAAAERMQRARRTFEEIGDPEGAIRAIHAQGTLAASRESWADALSLYREALQRAREAHDDPSLEMAIRLSLCRLQVETTQLPQAEDEIRRAEELAIANNLSRLLAHLYVIMGRLRGTQGDENGFVFFEKALELCGGLEPSPRLEAEVYLEYARFRLLLEDRDSARAYLERAREIFDLLDDPVALKRVDDELEQLPGPEA